MDRPRIRLTEAEKELLINLRASRREAAARAGGSQLSEEEQQLLDQWRAWQESPATRPPWAAALQHQLRAAEATSAEPTGLSDRSGYLAEAPSRLLGCLLGGAAGEAVARQTSGVGERTSAMLFVLDGLIRAHTRLRTSSADPSEYALTGLQRWLHTHGIAWQDCVPADSFSAMDGWIAEQEALRAPGTHDPVMLTALARNAAGVPQGTPQQPINRADSASAVPLGALAAVWSDDHKAVFRLGGELAALSHGDPHGHHPAGVLGTAVFCLLRGRALGESLEAGIANWRSLRHSPAQDELARALRLGKNCPPGFLPTRTQIEAMNAGRSAVEALSIAIRVAMACGDDFTAAIEVAASHGGDTATSAMVCGQLLGALHGPTVIPKQWLKDLAARPLAEQLADDAATEFGPSPDDSDQWHQRYPPPPDAVEPPLAGTEGFQTGLTTTSQPALSRERFVGSVLGASVGEALGTPITGDSWQEIQTRHGERGLADYVPAGHPSGRLGSDTQIMLFSLEGMIRGNVSRRRSDTADPARHIQHAYQRWLHTQHLSWPRAAGEFLTSTPEPDGWLVKQRALCQTRNPGRTMMRTLIAFAKGQQSMGTPEHPVSDSQGSAALMRAVPATLWSHDPEEIFRVAMNTATLTHGDPVAYLSTGALAVLVFRLMRGEDLRTAADLAAEQAAKHAGHEEVTRRLHAATWLADSGESGPAIIETHLGSGRTAAEALAIGLFAALSSGGDFDNGLRVAVNHSGNSATSGAVCGSLVGALTGADDIPERWLASLELYEVIERLAQDAVNEFGARPPREQDWLDRYPPT